MESKILTIIWVVFVIGYPILNLNFDKGHDNWVLWWILFSVCGIIGIISFRFSKK